MLIDEVNGEVRSQLITILDDKDLWLDLVTYLPLTTGDVLEMRGNAGSSSDLLLKIMSARGYKLSSVYSLVKHLNIHRAITLLHPLIDASEIGDLSWLKGKDTNSNGQSLAHQRQYPPPSSRKKMSQVTKPSECKESISSVAVSQEPDFVATELQGLIIIPYFQLKQCTEGFNLKRVLGKGGYGIVYKGTWKDQEVAIKRVTYKKLNSDSQSSSLLLSQQDRERIQQTVSELKMLQMYRHDNILPIYACSFDGPEPCLVYQLMNNGTLEDRLLCRNNTPALDWNNRAQILIGTCRALHFLHTVQEEALIHGDVKSANILLDSFMQPKLGDFGLCRMGQGKTGSNQEWIVSHIKGTLAYLPPELMHNKLLSYKLDVFSFGVVIFEVVSGLRAYCQKRSPENLVFYALHNMDSLNIDSKEFRDLMVDDKAGNIHKESLVESLLFVARDCVNSESSQRPNMKIVLTKMLDVK